MQYQVIYPLRHNGKRYAPSEFIEMSADNAAPLLVIGTVMAIPPNVNQSVTSPPAAELTAGAIADIYAAAQAAKDSKPNVKDTLALLREHAPVAITIDGVEVKAADYKVNAELRDAAWEAYLAGDYPAATEKPFEQEDE